MLWRKSIVAINDNFRETVTAIAMIKRSAVSIGMFCGVNLDHPHQHTIKKTASRTDSMFPRCKNNSATIAPIRQNKMSHKVARWIWGAVLHHSRAREDPSTQHFHNWSGAHHKFAHLMWQQCRQLERLVPEEGAMETSFFVVEQDMKIPYNMSYNM